jgi:peptidoglycan hydrolase CwlO-like protein
MNSKTIIAILSVLLLVSIYFNVDGRKTSNTTDYDGQVARLNARIDSFQHVYDSLETEVKSMDSVMELYRGDIAKNETKIANLRNRLADVKDKYENIIDSVKHYTTSDMQRFFSDRYK